ncbi:TetR/AcrR family transcriptional regulator [Nocardioides albidus]|uniref:TetR/AcrR family transcriptional regulator n=1 Tax=Nocardioides albidus TaxID=1517589 RepID=A0A5C4VRQ0_9ACTN|nr:QsdR family transcriptional regulator [Nocardioides albidus]TNM38517.1 TetR/AcrR family transcriptional regulator [Nocardioides albidus]
MDPRPAPVLTRLERPTRDHALDFARRLFVANERVDMQTLALALGVGRSTLYRWVGDRESLLGDVLARFSDDTWELARREGQGEGVERYLDITRRYMDYAASFEPLRSFAQREPGVALKVLMAPDGAVADSVRRGMAGALRASLGDEADALPDELVEIMAQAGTALQWSPIIIGDEPATERAIRLMHGLLGSTLSRPG